MSWRLLVHQEKMMSAGKKELKMNFVCWKIFSSLHMLKQMYSILESFNFFSTHVFFESVRYVPLSNICDNASAQVFKKAEEFFVTLSMA
ncbi:Angiotensin-converting enzyme 2 [Frankliniella fusca]|uniref:Angiotensin-converting enzyme 2 n=1 Tax=Frankliniella fusca TaxID=407009 RepID=A0AAE1HHI7_9NEOP|nr:Angiotensin-converting enzyme 2 [Frankliniella fusca]